MEATTPIRQITSFRQLTDPSKSTPQDTEALLLKRLSERKCTPTTDSLEFNNGLRLSQKQFQDRQEPPQRKNCQKLLTYNESDQTERKILPLKLLKRANSQTKPINRAQPPPKDLKSPIGPKRSSFKQGGQNRRKTVSFCSQLQDDSYSSDYSNNSVIINDSPIQKSGKTTCPSTIERISVVMSSSDGSYKKELGECSDHLEEFLTTVQINDQTQIPSTPENTHFPYESQLKKIKNIQSDITFGQQPCVVFCNFCQRQQTTQVVFESQSRHPLSKITNFICCFGQTNFIGSLVTVHRCSRCQRILAKICM